MGAYQVTNRQAVPSNVTDPYRGQHDTMFSGSTLKTGVMRRRNKQNLKSETLESEQSMPT